MPRKQPKDPPKRNLPEWQDARKKITDEQCAWILEARKDGATLRWCADKLGVSPAAVWRIQNKAEAGE